MATVSEPTIKRIHLDAPHRSSFVAAPNPTIGWVIESDSAHWQQAMAELELSRGLGALETRTLNDGKSVQVRWPFSPLKPREEAKLRIRVAGNDGLSGPWSEPIAIRAGFLGEGEWKANSIALSGPDAYAQPAMLRKEFTVRSGVSTALIYATAVGVYQVAINGVDVDDQVLKPGWTPYHERTIHETTDVTALLRTGTNVLTVRLAGGWATERFSWGSGPAPSYASQPRFAAQLRMDFDDGKHELVLTDSTWLAAAGPSTRSGLYDGEDFDARFAWCGPEVTPPSDPSFDDSTWRPVSPADPLAIPVARSGPMVRRMGEIPARSIATSPSGKTIVDFGQNLVGRVRIRVQGPPGQVVALRHAEVLEGGELCTRPLRTAQATDRYTLAGGGLEEWEPEFTFHGFRYVEVSGWPGDLQLEQITAVIIHSDMARTGWFHSSSALINQLHENIAWGLRGNFLYLPTDCPQRDERLGWTGDIQVFAPTASFIYDVRSFLSSWLVDLSVEQRKFRGEVPSVVPNPFEDSRPAAAWGDAATVVPWVLMERYLDEQTLSVQYSSMKDWTEVICAWAGSRKLWEGRFQFGDWLDPAAPHDEPGQSRTSPDLVASAYLYRSTKLTAEAANILGKTEDAHRFGIEAEEIRQAFLAEYVGEKGLMSSDTETAYALAIHFGIAGELSPVLGMRLADLVRRRQHHIGTGFVGTPIIQDALTATGHIDDAELLLMQTGCPSWLFPVTMGATTIWERWDSLLPNGVVNPGGMTSFNHYAFGAIGDWLHRTVAGLAPDLPGYKRLLIEPQFLSDLSYASAELETQFGLAAVSWRRSGRSIDIEILVPTCVTARVILPHRQFEVGSGRHHWTFPDAKLRRQGPRQA